MAGSGREEMAGRPASKRNSSSAATDIFESDRHSVELQVLDVCNLDDIHKMDRGCIYRHEERYIYTCA